MASTSSTRVMPVEEKCIENYRYLFHPDLLKGKVAFITGGGTGIGFTITELLMRHGCDTAIASRRLEVVQRSARVLETATNRKCLPLQADVRKPQTIIEAVEAVIARFGRIDILINNAAGNFLAPVSGLSFNAFKTVIDIDLIGTFNTSKVVYEKYMRDHGGVILNISATLHYKGNPLQAHAGCAKAGIDALTKHLAVEWGPNKIRVVAVAPGPIGDTEGMRRLSTPESLIEAAKQIPVGRVGRREDIGNAVLYLTSEAGSFVTGEVFVVDGAHWMAPGYDIQKQMRAQFASKM